MTHARVAIIHPDLGIGGAERLILDVALAVKTEFPVTTIWTSRYEPDRAFPDTKKFQVTVCGNRIPRHIFGCFHIFFALLRNLWLTIRCARESGANIFIVDQISAWLPLLKWLRPDAKIIFYCHFPDLLLAPHSSFVRRVYRWLFDFAEIKGIRKADLTLVNSQFTAGKVASVLKVTNVEVLYPCVNCDQPQLRHWPPPPHFLSINRYEEKKNHNLAIQALAILVGTRPDAHLTIAGGYDPNVAENVNHEKELIDFAAYCRIPDKVTFLRNVSDDEKWRLMAESAAVLYTPQNEHFGIVPIEALSLGTPVIACNSGGPCETLNVVGCHLCESTPQSFADAMLLVIGDSDRSDALKAHARKFGFDEFTKRWIHILETL
jgi:alpha-1,3/alpha-1,6-mannosyltransferase